MAYLLFLYYTEKLHCDMAEVVYSLQVQEVGAAQHPTVGETRVGAPGDSRGPAAASSVVETDKLSVDNAYQGTEFRSPSPEYVDAVQEQQQEDQEREVEAMGETTTRRDTNEVNLCGGARLISRTLANEARYGS